MNSNNQLELLKFLENFPVVPEVAPMPLVTKKDPFIKIPKIIDEYAKAVDIKPHLEKNGKIHIDNYLVLLYRLRIKHYGLILLTEVENKPT